MNDYDILSDELRRMVEALDKAIEADQDFDREIREQAPVARFNDEIEA